MTLDELDRRLIDTIQSGFPIESRPFQDLADRIGVTETEALERIRELHRQGYVRELGAVFDLKRLGYSSTLCAARVAPEVVDAVTSLINSFPEVTHNYLRDHAFNIWFTVIARSDAEIEKILQRVRAATGAAQVLSLPQRRMFKIQVHFPTGAPAEPEHQTPKTPRPEPITTAPVFQAWEIRLLRVLSDPLPLVERPFAAVAHRAEVLEGLAIERIRAWLADGTIRRFGARVDHHAVGYPANGMSVWKVAPDEGESAGKYMAAQPEVSHCYLRDVQPGWDYNLYAMIHGPSREAVEAVARRISDHASLGNYAVLYSTKELKKTAPRYFTES